MFKLKIKSFSRNCSNTMYLTQFVFELPTVHGCIVNLVDIHALCYYLRQKQAVNSRYETKACSNNYGR
jgi:hypothetical protein